MANKTHYPVRARATELVLLSGTFDTNSTSAPTGVTGDISTVTRTGTGAYTVTWKSAYPQRDWQVATIEEDDGALAVKCIGGTVSAGTTTLKVWTEQVDAAETAAAVTTGVVVSAHAATLASAGYVISVDATTATAAGAKKISHVTAPAEGDVKVEYTAGVATLTFNATDNVTAAAVTLLPVEGALAASQAADSTSKTIRVFQLVRNTTRTAR